MVKEWRNDIDRVSFYRDQVNNPNNISSWLPKIQASGFSIPETTILPMDDELEYLCSTDVYGDTNDAEAEEAYKQRTLEKIRNVGIPDGKELFVKAGAFSWRNIFFYPHVTEKQGIVSIPGKYACIFASAKSFNYPTGAELVIREFIHTGYDRPTILSGQKLNPEFRMIYDFDTHAILGLYPYFQEINYATFFPDMHQEHAPGWIDAVDGLGALREMKPELDEEFLRLKPDLEREALEKLKDVSMSDVWYIDFLHDGERFWLIDMSLLKTVTLYDPGIL